MIKSNVLAILLLSTIAYSATSVAQSNCQVQGNNTQQLKRYLQCLDTEIAELQQQQQIWINKLTIELEEIEENTGNSQLLPIFKRSLTNQARYLEDSCRWRYLQKMPNSSKAAITYKECEITILTQHLNVLKQPLQ